MNKYIKGVILALVVIALLYQFGATVVIRKKVDILESTISGNYSHIIDSINGANYNVQNTLDEELSKSHLTKNVDFKLNKLEKDKAILNIRAELSRINTDAKVYFMYREQGYEKWNEISLIEEGNLSYIGTMEYKFDSKYEYKIVTKGYTSESGDITNLDKYVFMPYPPQVSYGESYEEGNEKLTLSISMDNNIYVDDEGNYYEEQNKNINGNIKMKSIDFILGINKKEKTYKCEYYKNEGKDSNGESWIEEGYRVDIAKNDYKGKLDYIKMKITYSDGLIDIKDVTSEIEKSFIE